MISKKIALKIAYDGASFYGWQAQNPSLPTIQSHLEAALSQVAAHPIQTRCAGRTDAGVHALGQVVDFDTTAQRSLWSWIAGTNANLLASIRVLGAVEVSSSFHARQSALSRCYRYWVVNQPIRPAIGHQQLTWHYRPLCEKKMQEAAQAWLGEHDFSAFRAAECQSKSPMRRIDRISITRMSNRICIEVEANAFLHHMVRNLVGVLMEIGAGVKPVAWAQAVLASRDRRQAAMTAPANGLYLVSVRYPSEFELDTLNHLNSDNQEAFLCEEVNELVF